MSIKIEVTLEENKAKAILDLMNTWGKVCADFTKGPKSEDNFNSEIKKSIDEKPHLLVPAELHELGFYNIRIEPETNEVNASFKQFRYYGLYVKKELISDELQNKMTINYECTYRAAEKIVRESEF